MHLRYIIPWPNCNKKIQSPREETNKLREYIYIYFPKLYPRDRIKIQTPTWKTHEFEKINVKDIFLAAEMQS